MRAGMVVLCVRLWLMVRVMMLLRGLLRDCNGYWSAVRAMYMGR